MRKLATLFVLMSLAAVPLALAATGRAADELTFSASASNPNDGQTTFDLNVQYLIGAAGNFLLGPTVTMFDAGETDGGLFGVAGKLRIGKTSGFWLGFRVQKPSGDVADSVDYAADGLAGFDVGTEHVFATFYGGRTWTRDKAGATTNPEGTNFNAGLGWRF